LGHWNEALAAARNSAALDPRIVGNSLDLANLQVLVMQFPDAIRTNEDIRSRFPETSWYLSARIAMDHLMADGDLDADRRTLDSLPAGDVSHETRMYLYTLERNYAAGLRELTYLPDFIEGTMVSPKPLYVGYMRRHAGDSAAASADFDTARTILEPAVRASPNEPRLRAALAWAYSGLGRHADAIREARRAADLDPESRDAWVGPFYTAELARTYAEAGEKDAAFALLQHLIRVPAGVPAVDLRLNDNWDALRGDPRFPALVATAEAVQRNGLLRH
jgi:tetratricopeptide (TPR) repeat protein